MQYTSVIELLCWFAKITNQTLFVMNLLPICKCSMQSLIPDLLTWWANESRAALKMDGANVSFSLTFPLSPQSLVFGLLSLISAETNIH